MGLGWTMADYVNRPSCIYPESGHGPASRDRSLLLIIGKVRTVLSFNMCIADTFGRFWTLLFKREMEGEGGEAAGGEGPVTRAQLRRSRELRTAASEGAAEEQGSEPVGKGEK